MRCLNPPPRIQYRFVSVIYAGAYTRRLSHFGLSFFVCFARPGRFNSASQLPPFFFFFSFLPLHPVLLIPLFCPYASILREGIIFRDIEASFPPHRTGVNASLIQTLNGEGEEKKKGSGNYSDIFTGKNNLRPLPTI